MLQQNTTNRRVDTANYRHYQRRGNVPSARGARSTSRNDWLTAITTITATTTQGKLLPARAPRRRRRPCTSAAPSTSRSSGTAPTGSAKESCACRGWTWTAPASSWPSRHTFFFKVYKPDVRRSVQQAIQNTSLVDKVSNHVSRETLGLRHADGAAGWQYPEDLEVHIGMWIERIGPGCAKHQDGIVRTAYASAQVSIRTCDQDR